ncbi:hypothetical protein ACHAXN_005765 [Cyclotella atomus]
MKRTHPITAALAATCSILSIASAEPDNESGTTLIRRGIHSRITSNDDRRRSNPLTDSTPTRNLQTTTCTGNKMMCGCTSTRQSEYRGRFSVTQSGFKCKSWSHVSSSYPDQGLDDGAYCRNPNSVGERAWCFVEDGYGVMWDYCNVAECTVEQEYVDAGTTTTDGCFTTSRYYEIYNDIETIKNSIGNDVDRSHFLGGIVRMVAHDFMDYDMAESNTMGADGCLLFDSPKNAGLTSIWCDSCPLKQLYDSKYSDLSRADFWVASANAVIYLTSVNNALDLRNAFLWGRETTDSCFGSDDRLPTSAGCQEVEGVFLQRMGLTWKDAVALLGAHTLGRAGFSSHHGTWAANDVEAQIFDKSYFDELFGRAWTPRGLGTAQQDWTWISGNPNNSSPKLMLNTDMCLVYDIDSSKQCCSNTRVFKPNGQSRCDNYSNRQCRMYSSSNSRIEATAAAATYLGGTSANSNQTPFYRAFTLAWYKATTNGQYNLNPLSDTCQ